MTKKNKKSSVQNKVRTLDFYIYRNYIYIAAKRKDDLLCLMNIRKCCQ